MKKTLIGMLICSMAFLVAQCSNSMSPTGTELHEGRAMNDTSFTGDTIPTPGSIQDTAFIQPQDSESETDSAADTAVIHQSYTTTPVPMPIDTNMTPGTDSGTYSPAACRYKRVEGRVVFKSKAVDTSYSDSSYAGTYWVTFHFRSGKTVKKFRTSSVSASVAREIVVGKPYKAVGLFRKAGTCDPEKFKVPALGVTL